MEGRFNDILELKWIDITIINVAERPFVDCVDSHSSTHFIEFLLSVISSKLGASLIAKQIDKKCRTHHYHYFLISVFLLSIIGPLILIV